VEQGNYTFTGVKMKTYGFADNIPFSHFLNDRMRNAEFNVHIVPDLPIGFSFSQDLDLYLQNEDELKWLLEKGMIKEVIKQPRVVWLAPFEVIENGVQRVRYKQVDADSSYQGKIKAIEVFE